MAVGRNTLAELDLIIRKGKTAMKKALTIFLASILFTGHAMAATLNGTTPASTYGNLLQAPTSNAGLTSSLVQIQDGKGNAVPFYVSTSNVEALTGEFLLLGSSTGYTTIDSANASSSNYTLTLPAVTDTVATIGTAQTWTAAQTFTNSDIKLLGSSTGATTFTSGNSSATNYTLTVPAITSTVATLGSSQTFSGTNNFTGNTGFAYASPTSGAAFAGGLQLGATSYTTTQNSASADIIVLCNTSSAAWTYTLPAPGSNYNRYLVIKDTGNATTHHLTIAPHASETIDGASSYVLTINYATVTLVSDGTNWWVVGSYNGTVI
jgi:hypothetical protein